MHPSYSELRWNCQHSRKLPCEYWNPFLWQNAFPQLTSANNHQRALKPVLEQMQCCSWRDVAKQAAEKLHGDSMIKGNLPHLTIKSMSTQQTSLLGSWVRLAFSILSWPRTNLHTHSVSKHFSTGVLGCPPSVLGAPLVHIKLDSQRFALKAARAECTAVCLGLSVSDGLPGSVRLGRAGHTDEHTTMSIMQSPPGYVSGIADVYLRSHTNNHTCDISFYQCSKNHQKHTISRNERPPPN